MTDGDKDKDKEAKASRPVTAAARRERRGAARPTGKSGEARPSSKGRTSPAKASGKEKATPKRGSKDKQASPFKRLARFFREVWAELRKVIWPTRKQMGTYTVVVLIFVVFMVALVAGLDFVFLKGMDFVFGK